MKRSKLYVLYENPEWLEPLEKALGEQGLQFEPWFVDESMIDLDQEPPEGVFWNRLSASSASRDHQYSLESGHRILSWLEHWGRRVVNGSEVVALERSKFLQHLQFHRHQIQAPRSHFIVGGREQLEQGRRKMSYPFIYKYDCGGKGLGVQKISSDEEWQQFLDLDSWRAAPGNRHIIQDYIVPKEPFITRCEFIGGRFHYAIKADTSQGFELCPADGCHTDSCQLSEDDPSRPKFTLRRDVPQDLIAQYERLLASANIEVAGIEFIESHDGKLYSYDINCNTNYAPAIETSGEVTPGFHRIAAFLSELLIEGEEGK
ncbi:ATP-grasp domain-containing protein [Pseudobacteriovorax antillogorgiicola]|uniref:Glutathione synthase/RimK-type ligase, ATP-grasp superfamily n=1 Tax=Pseudobacteriovorax antillogorgiicola TaxID=1513793 RepID=A0A1Y6C2A9_9BACT|nr:alpha-L-glutamate ligase [Pseudobacteriovorax antillogorgiicola]TCS52339.1 glutathione synthase/RimK-type ligase-like ATP-grasp enzyme [Pseudobacteriovorax antillogorgiicola]SMF29771.1 Glutathione synthase/RimK-type ligase, ATP-grasp superfamily [Pseudobacteriovorax antillogorgiicola]